ncbi:MAG: DUF2508 family protein [Clostridiales bacterium]|jgi:hypothetical protein|nr:DUF2508 family protein [Clostridiales bacterium]
MYIAPIQGGSAAIRREDGLMLSKTTSNAGKTKGRGGKRAEQPDPEFSDILKGLETRLEVAYNNLNNQTNDILIDSCIYEIYALNKKHEYFLSLCKSRETRAE